MVGQGEFLSETEGPEDLQNRSQPGERLVSRRVVACQPMSGAGEYLAQEGSSRLCRVQAVGPAAEGGGIRHVIRIFERRRRVFPGAVLLKAPAQGPTTSQQAVVGVREGKRRQKGEGFPATPALTSTDWDPVVVCVVRLLAASSVTSDRIALTNRTSSQDDAGALFGPIRIELVRCDRKWDKKNRGSLGLCPGVDLPGSEPEAEPLLLKKNSNWKRITLLGYSL